MLGDETKNDKNFTPESYEDFYEHHYFKPLDDSMAYSVDDYLPRFKWALDRIQTLTPASLLDIGCLDGSFVLTAARKLKIPVTGIDLSVDGIRIAEERASHSAIEATFKQGSAEKLLASFARQKLKFDVITFFEVIEHVENVQKLLTLIDKVLAPGGSVFLTTPDFESPHYGLDDEQNTCHIRLYTLADKDYEKKNKFGHIRKATSMSLELGKDRIQEMALVGDQICVHYV